MKALVFLLFFTSQSVHSLETVTRLRITGEAFDVKSQELVYREQHLIDDKLHTVSYSDKDGNVFAQKKISYEISFVAPVYKLNDQRFSRETGSQIKDKQWSMYRSEKSGTYDELLLKNQENLVIDAGFNNFIRLHFDALDSGDLLNFNFGLTDPLIELSMEIQRIPCTDYQPKQNNEKNICLRAINSSLFYRWFVPTIYLVYDRDSRFLMRYEGPSNLPDNNDSAQTVRINYVYSSPTIGKLL